MNIKSVLTLRHWITIARMSLTFTHRLPPTRNFGNLVEDQALNSFLKDADMDGRSLNAFMSEAQMWSGVYGHVWLIMDKPAVIANTRADELAQQVRPYLTLITPENVLDWGKGHHQRL